MNGVAFSSERPAGALRLGSEEHLRLFCLEPLETDDPYKPVVMAWPALDAETRHRVTSLPIWDRWRRNMPWYRRPYFEAARRRYQLQTARWHLTTHDLAPYDPRLKRPRFVPAAIRLATRFMKN